MSKRFFAAAFAVGLAAVAWIAFGFAGNNWTALAITVVIGGVYLLGAFELTQFRAATTGLGAPLDDLSQPPATLSDWLARVPSSLRDAARLRVEGQRAGLPGPALTPFLVGLLVMLGMLGTFLGMVMTFKGAVFALERSGDLQAIRSALSEPIKGLGLSFGTSVAGVAASAMLGLMSAISRRERMEVGRNLDSRIATVLLPFSLVHQRQETFRAVQLQARALPELVERLDAMMERIEGRARQLDEQLLGRHAEFQREATLAYSGLAQSVGNSLKDSLATGARAAGDTIAPVVERAMTQIVHESQRAHERLGDVAQTKVDALLAGVNDSLHRAQSEQAAVEARRSDAWAGAVQTMAAELQRLLAQSQELVHARSETEARWSDQHGQRMAQLAGVWRTELAALREEESARGQLAVARLGELQTAVSQHLATLGAALEAPMTRLLQTASEVPQAAAGVMAQLRDEMSRAAERDNLALAERTSLLEQLATLLNSVNQASGEQRAAVEALVASASSVFEQARAQFGEALDAHAGKAVDIATHVTAGAVELTSVAEAFGHSVQTFQATNDQLVQSLQRVEASIERSTARSDEQLAYYVAQAREVIDLSIASQEGMVENLRQLQGKGGKTLALAAEARA